MKKLARLAALLLTAALALTMLAGCSGSFQTNPQAEEAILKYVEDTYTTRDKPLTNDSTMYRKAAEVLAKVTADGMISAKDYYPHFSNNEYGTTDKREATFACIVIPESGTPSDEMLSMEAYTAGQIPTALDMVLSNYDWITSFGVATRVIDGKTYVAISYVCHKYYHESSRPD